MTTTVTVETHDWPVAVTQSGDTSYATDTQRSSGWTNTETFVPANTKQAFNVTDRMTVAVRDLPVDATGLEQSQGVLNSALSASNQRVSLAR